MYWNVFYVVVAGLLQLTVCYVKEGHEVELLSDHLSSEEYQVMAEKSNLNERDHDNIIESDDRDKDPMEEIPEEEKVSFSGPVKAKGRVAMAANFGYNAPGSFNYQSYSINPSILQFHPQYFYPTSFAYHTPLVFPYYTTASFILPGLGGIHYSENEIENSGQCKSDVKPSKKSEDDLEKPQDEEIKLSKKDFFLKVTPIVKVIETLLEGKDDMEKTVETPSLEEALANPVAFLDEDFTDYDENNALDDKLTEANDIKNTENDTDSPKDRMVFGGFLPARGTVKIAARF